MGTCQRYDFRGADNGIEWQVGRISFRIICSMVLWKQLFTVDEETGLTGAFGMKEGFISGDYLLNLDSEDEAENFS